MSSRVETEREAPQQSQTRLRLEIILVLAVSLGMSALYAIVNLIGDLTAKQPLSSQQAVLNASQAPNRPWLDLALQLLGILAGIVPAFLAIFLLVQSGRSPASIGLDRTRLKLDGATGLGLACLIGIPGLGLVIAAHALGINAQVVAEDLPNVWWRYPVLLLSAFQNGALEEIVVVAYLITRLEQLGWRPKYALLGSSVLRGSYHLYQGFGGFLGNFVMGLIFGYYFQRTRRVLPLIVAHTLIDAVSFVGYALLRGHVSWLP
jgi:membrane protease YdiL (CAAX protease family)